MTAPPVTGSMWQMRKPSNCPDRAVAVSAPPPDPRAVEMAHHPPGQADVQHSLSGRHGAGRGGG
ncbi:MAG TPA: hypothetical protein VGI26_02085, partial [Solirubrobacteraceae bacterium]